MMERMSQRGKHQKEWKKGQVTQEKGSQRQMQRERENNEKMEGKSGQQDGRDGEGETNAFVIHYLLCTEQLNRVADMHLLIEMT